MGQGCRPSWAFVGRAASWQTDDLLGLRSFLVDSAPCPWWRRLRPALMSVDSLVGGGWAPGGCARGSWGLAEPAGGPGLTAPASAQHLPWGRILPRGHRGSDSARPALEPSTGSWDNRGHGLPTAPALQEPPRAGKWTCLSLPPSISVRKGPQVGRGDSLRLTLEDARLSERLVTEGRP